ncbi:FadR/GntR family transcriptional regulator [Arthrobacter citreus]|uniref:FadR/GntR family transcriptional regulator n=1 Tax=Arthrobacter citreus TaxID=1670 RepID=UPI0031F918F2
MSPHLTSDLVGALRAEIVEGRISPGDRLPSESALIARHGVSRTVVREAVARLQAEGLIHTRRGSGSFVLVPPTPEHSGTSRPARTLQERVELLEFRTAIECEAAALAALRRTPAQCAALEAALDNFEAAAGNPAAALGFDYAFHHAVAEASANPYLADALQNLGPAMISMPKERLQAATDSGTDVGPVSAEHRAVLDAVIAGDALAAAAAMRIHLAGSRRRLEAGAGQKA